jgi:hypothetical protein
MMSFRYLPDYETITWVRVEFRAVITTNYVPSTSLLHFSFTLPFGGVGHHFVEWCVPFQG